MQDKSIPKNSENFRQLTSKQERALLLTLEGKTTRDIAQSLGMSERTVYQWTLNPEFQKQLREEKNKIREAALDRLKQLVGKAVERLEGLLASESDSVKLRACVAILDYTLKAKELEEVEERLTALEKKMEDNKNGRH